LLSRHGEIKRFWCGTGKESEEYSTMRNNKIGGAYDTISNKKPARSCGAIESNHMAHGYECAQHARGYAWIQISLFCRERTCSLFSVHSPKHVELPGIKQERKFFMEGERGNAFLSCSYLESYLTCRRWSHG
jgi:hypothetical protein